MNNVYRVILLIYLCLNKAAGFYSSFDAKFCNFKMQQIVILAIVIINNTLSLY